MCLYILGVKLKVFSVVLVLAIIAAYRAPVCTEVVTFPP